MPNISEGEVIVPLCDIPITALPRNGLEPIVIGYADLFAVIFWARQPGCDPHWEITEWRNENGVAFCASDIHRTTFDMAMSADFKRKVQSAVEADQPRVDGNREHRLLRRELV